MKIYVIRHGQTDVNVLGMTYDEQNSQTLLTRIGREQAAAAARALRNVPFDAVFCSEMIRTQETAHIINEQHNLPIKIDGRLNDRRTGVASMLDADYYRMLQLKRDVFAARLGNGESWNDEKARIASFLDWLKTQPYTCVLIVTHLECMRNIDGYFTKTPDAELLHKSFKNCEHVVYTL